MGVPSPIDDIFTRSIIKHLRGHITNQKQKDRIGKLIEKMVEILSEKRVKKAEKEPTPTPDDSKSQSASKPKSTLVKRDAPRVREKLFEEEAKPKKVILTQNNVATPNKDQPIVPIPRGVYTQAQ